jgi:hypothetical protein
MAAKGFRGTEGSIAGKLLRNKGQQGDDPGPFNGQGQNPLMLCTGAGDTPGQYLSPFGNKAAEGVGVLIIYFYFLDAEFADFLLEINLALAPAAIFSVPAVHLGIHAPVLAGGPFIIGISFIRHITLLV